MPLIIESNDWSPSFVWQQADGGAVPDGTEEFALFTPFVESISDVHAVTEEFSLFSPFVEGIYQLLTYNANESQDWTGVIPWVQALKPGALTTDLTLAIPWLQATWGEVANGQSFTNKSPSWEAQQFVGFFCGEPQDSIPPYVDNIAPFPGTLLAKDQAVSFDVLDYDPGVQVITIWALIGEFLEPLLVWDGFKFRGRFLGSQVINITGVPPSIPGGAHFTLRFLGGWPGAIYELEVRALDINNNYLP